MLFYSEKITPRIQYICDFIGTESLGEAFTLTTDKNFFRLESGPKINYSQERIDEGECWLNPHSLLFETTIRPQPLTCFNEKGYKAFFQSRGDFPFDIFAASFYLLTRYEEYLPHRKDSYGRYAHENSLAFRENFLHLPLINIWISHFKGALLDKFPVLVKSAQLRIHPSKPAFLPTYDIDEAWSYQYKPFWKNAGGAIRSFFKGEWRHLAERITVMTKRKPDPYDAYQWMDQLHQRFNLTPYYFFILAAKRSRYDKNILPDKKAMQDLISRHSHKYPVGIHPSWQSGDDMSLIKKEKEKLEQITGTKIISSRQHYIRFTLPQTFRYLTGEAGIGSDFSMGYGSINGFRASVATPFYWYDLEKETATQLLLYPFCFMDANSFYEQKFSAGQAYQEMKQYADIIRQVNGTMITIWHNNFLGSAEVYAGWREAYEKFVSEIVG